jgi:hypothetical protein
MEGTDQINCMASPQGCDQPPRISPRATRMCSRVNQGRNQEPCHRSTILRYVQAFITEG